MRASTPRFDRRDFLKAASASVSAAFVGNGRSLAASSSAQAAPPVRVVTKGPKHHWFGYYDKLQFDPSGRFLLGMSVDFEHRSPRPDDVIEVGLVDLQDNDRWTKLGTSKAWCWQQGCMLQWLPGSDSEIIWNDRDGDRFVSHVLDVNTGAKRTIPAPIYAVSSDANWAVSPDFGRLQTYRPGYGYVGVSDPYEDVGAPDETGIWRTNLATGQTELILSFRQIAEIPYDGLLSKPTTPPEQAAHWFNHLLVAPGGERFVFLHRWKKPGDRSHLTRMITCKPDGSDLFILNPSGMTSHFIWRDPNHILGWALHESHGNKFYLFKDETNEVEVVGADAMTRDGHCTYLPRHDNRWILNDTYPDGDRLQHPYLFDLQTGRRHPLGGFPSPKEYTGEWRVDTHPRSSPDGRLVCIDSPHGDAGRQLHLIDISEILDNKL